MAVGSPKLRLISSPPRELKKVSSVLELIGDTPMLRMRALATGLPPSVRIFAKLEGCNPGGSVKDRAAWRMIQEGLRTKKLRPGKTILDSTSGNTGIALALIGRVLGYPVELVIPANVSVERKQILRAYRANVVYSDPMDGSDGAIRLCRKILEENPEKYFKPDQYFNPMNPQAHYETTGPEILRQTDGTITHFVAGIGTGGTVMGTGRYLKEVDSDIRVIAVEPDDALHGLEGLKHMASSIVPGIYHEEELDEKIAVSTDDAYAMVYRLSQEEGVLVGQSSGAAMFAALKIARKLRTGTVVTIFPDFGDKYLSSNLWVGWRDRMAVGNLKFSI
ncbi:MAG: PLP-dependent cysteine synthase family protein [Deltaproteobacteria bacterium]|nr:PLP-dependent cysteine synthase family protein [Deltaproteobacteria bacterium]